jgi:vacuolar-type H+-ATPase subunit E/Vma4
VATDVDSAETLRSEILEEGRKEADGVTARGRREAAAIAEAAAADADKVREEELERARNEASRRRESILSTVPVEAGRLRAGRVESLLNEVREEARRRLLAHEGFDYREALIELTAVAIGQMTGLSFVARFPDADRFLVCDGFQEEIVRRVDRKLLDLAVSFDPEAAQGGVVVEDAEGRQACDNGLLTRLERMWPELRRQIAKNASFLEAGNRGETAHDRGE